MPPPYSVATSLPTYDEAEKAKAAAMAAAAAETSQRVRQCYCFLLRIIFKIVLSTCIFYFYFSYFLYCWSFVSLCFDTLWVKYTFCIPWPPSFLFLLPFSCTLSQIVVILVFSLPIMYHFLNLISGISYTKTHPSHPSPCHPSDFLIQVTPTLLTSSLLMKYL